MSYSHRSEPTRATRAKARLGLDRLSNCTYHNQNTTEDTTQDYIYNFDNIRMSLGCSSSFFRFFFCRSMCTLALHALSFLYKIHRPQQQQHMNHFLIF